jgi:hypothetical protein
MAKTTEQKKIETLATLLGVDTGEAFDLIENGDYLVLTDKEADKKAKESILETVWAFNSSFLSAHSSLDAWTISIIQQAKYEDANEPLKKTIIDIDHFVDDAIGCDGRGHFLASYDHNETEVAWHNKTIFYVYRVN